MIWGLFKPLKSYCSTKINRCGEASEATMKWQLYQINIPQIRKIKMNLYIQHKFAVTSKDITHLNEYFGMIHDGGSSRNHIMFTSSTRFRSVPIALFATSYSEPAKHQMETTLTS